jgi:hypothetical protein
MGGGYQVFRLCPMAGFGSSGVEYSAYAATVFVIFISNSTLAFQWDVKDA